MPAPTVQARCIPIKSVAWRGAGESWRNVHDFTRMLSDAIQNGVHVEPSFGFLTEDRKKHFTGHCVLGLMPYWHWHCPFNWKTYLNELRGFRCTQNHDIALFLFLHIYSIYQEGGGGQDRVRVPSPAPGCLLTTANGTTILYPPSNDGFFNLSCS